LTNNSLIINRLLKVWLRNLQLYLFKRPRIKSARNLKYQPLKNQGCLSGQFL